jgi:hypothetical protein
VEESHYKDPDTGGARRGSAAGRLERSTSKWDSSSRVITDSPPMQPLSCRKRGKNLKPHLARHRSRRSFTRGRNYPKLLQTLIVQGLLRIEENDEIDEENEVTVFCRGEDEATVKEILPAAVKEYAEIMQLESVILLEPVVSVNADGSKDLIDKSYGGIALTDDRLFHLNQTIDN